MHGNTLIAALASVGILAACLGCQAHNQAESHGDDHTESVILTVTDQQTHGADLFATHCAQCHGVAGRGSGFIDLVGRRTLQSFRTAEELANYTRAAMPPNAETRAALSDDDQWAIVAYLLAERELNFAEPLDANAAKELELHRE